MIYTSAAKNIRGEKKREGEKERRREGEKGEKMRRR
jgi:hypothetical protein